MLDTDLVPKSIVEKWLKHLRNEFPAVAFKASTQTQKQHLVSRQHLDVNPSLFVYRLAIKTMEWYYISRHQVDWAVQNHVIFDYVKLTSNEQAHLSPWGNICCDCFNWKQKNENQNFNEALYIEIFKVGNKNIWFKMSLWVFSTACNRFSNNSSRFKC